MLTIPQNDHGALYVLEYTGDAPAVLTDQAMLHILGPVVLNLDFVGLIAPDQRTEVTLPDLIQQGYDLPMTAEQTDTLRQLTGNVLLVMSRAFNGQAQDIALPATTRLVMVLREQPAIAPTDKLTSASATGDMNGPPAKPRKSDARMSGMVATGALLVMFLLVGLMVWVGG
jgi:hypothetical protein